MLWKGALANGGETAAAMAAVAGAFNSDHPNHVCHLTVASVCTKTITDYAADGGAGGWLPNIKWIGLTNWSRKAG